MHVDKFSSMGSSVGLPSSKSPRVILAVENASIARNAFQLYNPFSQKAKVFKSLVNSFFCYANPLAKQLLAKNSSEKSKLQTYLEQEFGMALFLSVYRATAEDKVVVQLQSKEAEIIGYLKYPLNDLGLKHLKNEKKAIDILSANRIISSYKKKGAFENRPFLILEPLQGEIGLVDDLFITYLLSSFKRDKVFLLSKHPRILQLKQKLVDYEMTNYLETLNSLCKQSSNNYALAYEHGDFAPWNIVQVENKYIPFDFEFFVEDGIEFFDLIKYHYQVATLLEKKRGEELISYIKEKTGVEEFTLIFQLFLIKEITRCYEENEPYDADAKLLEQFTLGVIL